MYSIERKREKARAQWQVKLDRAQDAYIYREL